MAWRWCGRARGGRAEAGDWERAASARFSSSATAYGREKTAASGMNLILVGRHGRKKMGSLGWFFCDLGHQGVIRIERKKKKKQNMGWPGNLLGLVQRMTLRVRLTCDISVNSMANISYENQVRVITMRRLHFDSSVRQEEEFTKV